MVIPREFIHVLEARSMCNNITCSNAIQVDLWCSPYISASFLRTRSTDSRDVG